MVYMFQGLNYSVDKKHNNVFHKARQLLNFCYVECGEFSELEGKNCNI